MYLTMVTVNYSTIFKFYIQDIKKKKIMSIIAFIVNTLVMCSV